MISLSFSHKSRAGLGARPRTVARALVVATLALVATGCVSKVTGNEGNLTFQYPADDSLLDFNKPIAIGAKLDIMVREVGGNNPTVELSGATSDDPKVLAVRSFQGHTFVLEGIGDGSAMIEVTAKTSDGSIVKDSVNMLSRAAEVLKMRHYCTSESLGHYLVDQDIWIPYDLERKNGQSVIGYGYHPITIAPAAALAINQTDKDQVHFRFHTAATPQNASLTSTIDSAKLSVQLHTQGEIDGAIMDGGDAANKAQVALTHFVLIRPTFGGAPICQANADFTAETTTADVCTVTALTAKRTGKDIETGYGWIQITGKKVGKCNFNVSFTKANDGKGLVAPFEVNVIK